MFISYDCSNQLFLWKAFSNGWFSWIPAMHLFSSLQTMVWEGLSLLPRKTMLFKRNLSSKFPRIVPFKQKLLFKIQLLWHIFTLQRLSYGLRFKTMLSMTKSWASFSWNPSATIRVDYSLTKITETVWMNPHDLRNSIASRTNLYLPISH